MGDDPEWTDVNILSYLLLSLKKIKQIKYYFYLLYILCKIKEIKQKYNYVV